MSLEASDAAAAAVQKTPNRVTIEQLKARIKAQYTFTLDQALVGQHSMRVPQSAALDCITVCVMVMDNDFVLIGKSAAADPANFNKELGVKFAIEDALRQAWPLEAYLLKEKMRQGDIVEQQMKGSLG